MLQRALVLAFLLFLFEINSLHAEGRGMEVTVELSDEDNTPLALYRHSYALVIGIDEYKNWPRLTNAVKDAVAVDEALRKAGFETVLVTDPKAATRDKLDSLLREFFIKTGSDPEARLVFWFAGHGHSTAIDKVEQEGYVVPIEAVKPDDETQFQFDAISLRRFNEYMRLSKAKHILAVFDSCFSGTAFMVARSVPSPAIKRATAQKVRQFITSGDSNQLVDDNGRFRRLFVDAITGTDSRADSNGDHYVTGNELGFFLATEISNLTNNSQTPRYGTFREEGFNKGDTVFVIASADTHKKGDGKEASADNTTISVDPSPEDLIHQCDVLAAASYDSDRPSDISGVDLRKINSSDAVRICEKALRSKPNERRLLYELGRAYDGADNFKMAMPYYQKAAEKGSRAAMNELFYFYRDGLGTEKDIPRAIEWAKKAFVEGNEVAGTLAFEIGLKYSEGADKFEIDQAAARAWYAIALDNKSDKGASSLAALLDDAKGGGYAPTEAAALLVIGYCRDQTGSVEAIVNKRLNEWTEPVRTTLQEALQTHGGYKGEIDGKIGTATLAALEAGKERLCKEIEKILADQKGVFQSLSESGAISIDPRRSLN
jgi:tetratricopeptide (TPR) repeat protein